MGFFDSIQKPGFKAAKGKNSHIRQEITRTPTPPRTSIPLAQRLNNRPLQMLKQKSISRTPSPQDQERIPRKRAASTPQRLESDSSDDGTDQDLLSATKRIRRDSDVEPDIKRQIRSTKAFDENNWIVLMVHAAEIASLTSLSLSPKYHAEFPDNDSILRVTLEYPSVSLPERYELVVPNNGDDFKPLEEIREVIEIILGNYIPTDLDEQIAALLHHIHGLPIRLSRAVKEREAVEYRVIIEEYNECIVAHRKLGNIARAIDEWKTIDLKLLERILTQTYSRTVSPQVHLLRHYENGTDNVYGELLPKFTSLILKKDLKMKSDQIFVDLGSGVGNCVLQAALEIGCESWGCEMMEKACELAELQKQEFTVRCQLWGLSVGPMHLERGNFLENANILKILQKADVVLVNNQAFTPQLNEDLTSLFLDLKEGAKIVSLKSFVPSGHKISQKNLSAACNHLDVERKFYYSACVSWTDAPGNYYISTKDSARVKAFAERHL